ncbi:MAG: hypothetical protein SVR94_10220, partial [Pseudomonadota bacterium]|nr:hypothetical protein [Pseudomonadota bacterium]
IIPCLKLNAQLLPLKLELQLATASTWQSSGFEDADCQPQAGMCAVLDAQLNLEVPFKLDTLNYTALLTYLPTPQATGLTWQYRYHMLQTETLKSKALRNEAAYIPSQCYTQTIDEQEQVHNPCFTCHHRATPPHFINDDDIQLAYDFADYARVNRWENLFKNRQSQVAVLSDEAILAYIRTSNYQDEQGRLILAEKLRYLPTAWDVAGDRHWDGYLPDCYFNFDNQGFDRMPDSNYSGWRVFAYYPFPGTFWPANGSTDDVLIRLPLSFRLNAEDKFDETVYKVNLAIVEALIKRQDIAITPVDEQALGVDLDKDGQLAMADKIVYDWAPLAGRYMSYVGQAQQDLAQGKHHLAAGLYPVGTEFLHSVRYLDINDNGEIQMAARMKELRYARKIAWRTYSSLEHAAANEIKEKADFPDRLKQVIGDMERGVSTGNGWRYQGFIEDAQGQLRPQTYEEHMFCVGCHSGIGAITDSTFAFARKLPVDAYQQGWYHWNQRGLAGLAEPRRQEGQYEYSFYLQHNGAGDEFRANEEIKQRFFNADGSLKADMIAALHDNIGLLLLPSRKRALNLNKAYKIIVEEQSFKFGRDATIVPPIFVHQQVEQGERTGIEEILE